MRRRTVPLVAAALLIALTGCQSASEDGKDRDTGTLPNFVGKGLQSAQNQAQDADFHRLTSHDALGRGRMQALDRNWKVCFQTPAPGQHPTDTKVDFGTVKLDEDCPAKDSAPDVDSTPGSPMPDFTGKSVRAARDALDSATSLVVKDASGRDRMVVVESNWKICSQQPTPGTPLDGQPVTFRAVKFSETC
jgi:hypothetical protein